MPTPHKEISKLPTLCCRNASHVVSIKGVSCERALVKPHAVTYIQRAAF